MQNVPCMEYPVCMISLLYRAYSVCPILFLIDIKAEKGINYETHCMRILVQQCVMTSEETVSILSKGEGERGGGEREGEGRDKRTKVVMS